MGRKITIFEIESMARKNPDALEKLFTTIRLSYRDLLELKKAQEDGNFIDMSETLRFMFNVYKHYMANGKVQYEVEFSDGPVKSLIVAAREGIDPEHLAKEALIKEHGISEHEADILRLYKIKRIKRGIKQE